MPEKPSWKRTWPVVLGQWVLRFATGRKKTGGEAETQGEEGYEVEDTSATATEVEEVSNKEGVGKRRRVKVKGRR